MKLVVRVRGKVIVPRRERISRVRVSSTGDGHIWDPTRGQQWHSTTRTPPAKNKGDRTAHRGANAHESKEARLRACLRLRLRLSASASAPVCVCACLRLRLPRATRHAPTRHATRHAPASAPTPRGHATRHTPHATRQRATPRVTPRATRHAPTRHATRHAPRRARARQAQAGLSVNVKPRVSACL